MRERGHSLKQIRTATEEGRLSFGFLDGAAPVEPQRYSFQGGRARDDDRRGDAEGVQRVHRGVRGAASARRRADERDRGTGAGGGPPRGGPCRRGHVLGRARLHLPARPRRPDRRVRPRSARCMSTTGSGRTSDADERHCASCASGWASSSTSTPVRRVRRRVRRRQPPGVGARRALPRGRRPRAGRAARTSPSATRALIRWRRSSTGSRPRRAAARCSGMLARDGALVRPLLAFTREQTGAYCTDRGLALARRRDQRHRGVRAQSHPPRARPGAGADPPRGRRTTSWRWPRSCADEAEVLDELVDAVLDGRSEIALDARCASSRRRCGGSWCSGWPTPPPGRPAAGVARRADEVAAMPGRGTAALDLPSACAPPPRRGGRVRAHAQGRARASAGRRRNHGAKPPPKLPRREQRSSDRGDPRPRRGPQPPGARAGRARSRATTRARTCCSSACSRAPCSSSPT